MPSVGIVTTLKGNPDETVRFVNYHINIDIDHLFLFFDDPEDLAISLVEKYPKVTCIRCDDSYWSEVHESKRSSVGQRQGHNATFGLQMARKQGLEWLLHIDVDELVYSESGLKTILSNVPPKKDTVVLAPREAVPDTLESDRPFSSCFFRALPHLKQDWEYRFQLAFWMGCKKYFLKNRYFRGHQVGKSAVRVATNPFRINIHRPLFNDRKCRPFRKHDGVILHFESNNFDAWLQKMSYWLPQDWDQNPRAKTLTPQLEKIIKIINQGGFKKERRLRKLYKRLYFIGPIGRFKLRVLGLLEKIEIDAVLFEPPKKKFI